MNGALLPAAAAECTRRFPGPLHVYSSLYHMHGTGAAMVTQHVRNGTELPPFRRKAAYDFEHQGQMYMADKVSAAASSQLGRH